MNKVDHIIKKNICDEIYSLDKIICKSVKYMTFKDTISLIFHAVDVISAQDDHWADLYREFQIDMAKQNETSWPLITISKNTCFYRMDVQKINGQFISTSNVLSLIFRLLFVENNKRNAIYKYKMYKHIKMLWHKIDSKDDRPVALLDLNDIFILLTKYIKYYIDVYHDQTSCEYLLGKSILDQLE